LGSMNTMQPDPVMLSGAPRSCDLCQNPRRGVETSRRCFKSRCRHGEFWPRNCHSYPCCLETLNPKQDRKNSLQLHLLAKHARDLSTPRSRVYTTDKASMRSAQDDSCWRFRQTRRRGCYSVCGLQRRATEVSSLFQNLPCRVSSAHARSARSSSCPSSFPPAVST
jgi:hypothetical protein